MFQKTGIKSKLYFFLGSVFILSILVLNSIYNPMLCNIRRDYNKSAQDQFVRDIKSKIAGLEKDNIKDATTMQRLAEQYNLLGMYYLDKRLWDMAIEAFNSSVKYGNSGAAAYYSLGLAFANRGNEKNSQDDLAKAESSYRRAIEINSNYSDAKYALAILLFYHRNGRDEAQVLLEQVISRNKAFYPARFALGRFNYELGNREKALAIYRELSTDLDKLPPSDIANQYKEECSNNISRIQTELSVK